MYKNKRLKRSYVFAYVMSIFSLGVGALLSIKIHASLAIIVLILTLLSVAALITSHVYYKKDKRLYFIIGGSAVCSYNVIALYGFILEIVYTALGKGATYAWIMNIFTLLSGIILAIFFLLDHYKKED